MPQLSLFELPNKKYEKNILGGNLGKLSHIEDDEIYTPQKMVEAMLNPHLEYLKTKRILFPCDKDESEFVKYAEKHLLDFHNSYGDFRELSKHYIDGFDIIITNPPFSLKKDFILTFKHKEI
ncbi:MAG: adenine-specific methyltransferase EcoRI family protein [Bacteroidales bacterium]|jgi:hypothetical protein|nr:adenine-specific methyltransferase EcoRI family protein [Bacteroidales bacterium]